MNNRDNLQSPGAEGIPAPGVLVKGNNYQRRSIIFRVEVNLPEVIR